MAYFVMFGLVVLSIYLFILGISVARVEAERDEALRALETMVWSTQQATFNAQRMVGSGFSGFMFIVLIALILVAGYALFGI